ncbi:hypothetical protein DFQ29_005747 [Apophysomyces sp. BC1021]|nr:hypothetical protein DFQ29_005747 [Apophysomyces sp. BC1021]
MQLLLHDDGRNVSDIQAPIDAIKSNSSNRQAKIAAKVISALVHTSLVIADLRTTRKAMAALTIEMIRPFLPIYIASQFRGVKFEWQVATAVVRRSQALHAFECLKQALNQPLDKLLNYIWTYNLDDTDVTDELQTVPLMKYILTDYHTNYLKPTSITSTNEGTPFCENVLPTFK